MRDSIEQNSARLTATAFLAAFVVTACASVAPPVGPYPLPGPGGPGPAGSTSTQPRFLAQGPPLQCVPFARQVSGIEIYGDANTWWMQADGKFPRSRTPGVGSVIVIRTFQDGTRGHVAVVTRVISDRLIYVDHANWHGREEVAVNIPVRDISVSNDWSEVNVWWLDTNAWGRKAYQVDGFIHPR
jgi:hypothetical protein